MNIRKAILNLHLILSGLFIPFLIIIPLSGSLYLLNVKGTAEKQEVLRVHTLNPIEDKEVFFRSLFKDNQIDFDFEYIKENPNELIFRPANRVHYTARIVDGEVIVTKITPSLLNRLMELHKGHGPRIAKYYEAAFGISLILLLLTGIYLAWTVKSYRKIIGVSFLVGLIALIALFI